MNNKKTEWFDTNPLTPFQETGSQFKKTLKKIETQNSIAPIELKEHRLSVTTSKKKLNNSATLERIDSIKSNYEEELE